MIVQGVEIEVVEGGGVDLTVDAVALESVEDYPIENGEALSVIGGGEHYYTIIANLFFERSIDDVERVRQGYADVLKKAAELDATTLALIPFGFEKGIISPVASAKVLAQELLKFIRFGKHHITKIFVCVTDTDHFDIFKNNIIGYVTHVQDTLGMGPYVTVDAIIEFPKGIVIIERSNPPYGYALPGGFVDYGESLESAVRREILEETGISPKDIRQFKVFSDPARDPRFHTVTTVFIGRGTGNPAAGDDAKSLKVVPYEELMTLNYAFDHKQVIQEYLEQRKTKSKMAGFFSSLCCRCQRR
ncbi:MAG: NUDIX hydrolase [Candidatus Omnitrophota bacterium]